MNTPTAVELVDGLGQPVHGRSCDRVIKEEFGIPTIQCSWVSGLYYDPKEADRALRDHEMARHGAGRKGWIPEAEL